MGSFQPFQNEPAAAIYIYMNGDPVNIERNQVYNSYQVAIKTMRSNNVTIKDNLIDGPGVLNANAVTGDPDGWNDAFGMYSRTSSGATALNTSTYTVTGNILKNISGFDNAICACWSGDSASNVQIYNNHFWGSPSWVEDTGNSPNIVKNPNEFCDASGNGCQYQSCSVDSNGNRNCVAASPHP